MVFETKQKRRNLDDYAPLVRVDALDRISQFPEHIIHHFLFFMPPKDAARTSALSKTWRQARNSLRRSDFTFSDFVEEETTKFVKSVDEALQPLREHKTIIQCFRLSMTLCDDKYASCIDNWMELANRNHMEKLYLDLNRMEKVKRYVLPKTTFSFESLAKLTLKGCKLLGDYFGDNMNKFICSRKLTLERVGVDDLTITKILHCCPLLEEFIQWYCSLKAECVHINHAPKLKKAKLYGVERIKIEAPNLEELYCSGYCGELDLDFLGCNNVKKLDIHDFEIPKQLFQEFNSKVPLLETLDLGFFDDIDILKISSNRLKSLRLESFGESPMLQVQVNCENLHSFKYDSNVIPSSFSITPCCQLQIENTLHLHDHVDTFWFLTLRQYLGNFKEHQTLKLHFFSSMIISFTSEELSKDLSISPVASIQRLELWNVPIMQDYTDLLDGLLWSCHPKFLVIHPNSKEKEFIKFLGETLLNGDEEAKCCGDSQMKCWRHCIRAVKSEYSYLHRGKMKYVKSRHCDAFFDTLSTHGIIQFNLKFSWDA